MICEKGECENMSYTYTKFCCDGKQRNETISGYLIDVKERFKVFTHTKNVSQMAFRSPKYRLTAVSVVFLC